MVAGLPGREKSLMMSS